MGCKEAGIYPLFVELIAARRLGRAKVRARSDSSW